MINLIRLALGSMIVAVALTFSGCVGMQGQSTLDEIAGSGEGGPWTEAFIEYAGPQARWAGPSTFILHVQAKDAGSAVISVTPALFNDVKVRGRKLASVAMTGDKAREQLANLATSLQGADSLFRGCLSPVRVRLIRADGAVLEKHGCRGSTGWNKIASESVNSFISAVFEQS